MKNQIFKNLACVLFIIGLTVSGCSQSTSSSGDDPTLLAFLVNNGGGPNVTQSTCLGNVFLINTCVGAAATGEGLPGTVCSSNSGSEEERALGALLSTPFAKGCISGAIQESGCNLPTNKPLDVVDAFDGPFASVIECITEQIP